MNRRTLDVLLPMLYALAIVTASLFSTGKAVTAVAVIGSILIGIYFAALRQNLTPKE